MPPNSISIVGGIIYYVYLTVILVFECTNFYFAFPNKPHVGYIQINKCAIAKCPVRHRQKAVCAASL